MKSTGVGDPIPNHEQKGMIGGHVVVGRCRVGRGYHSGGGSGLCAFLIDFDIGLVGDCADKQIELIGDAAEVAVALEGQLHAERLQWFAQLLPPSHLQ